MKRNLIELPARWYSTQGLPENFLYISAMSNMRVPLGIQQYRYSMYKAWSIPVFFNRFMFDQETVQAAEKIFQELYPTVYKRYK